MAKKTIKKVYVGKEAGVTGNAGFLGASDTGEYLTSLKGQAGMAVFDEMRRSDGQVKAVLKAITLPILKNKYFIEPASDDSIDIEIAEKVWTNISKDMTMTWSDTLRHIMLHKVFGFMPMEKVYEYNKEENLIKIRKLDPRMPQSIQNWNFKNQSLIDLTQVDNMGKIYKIPIEKLCIFTEEKEGSNWEGVSLLRPVYGNWFIKKDLMKIDAIRHERYGVGVPMATAPEGVDENDPAWAAMEETLQAVYSNEQSYIVKPAGWEVDVLNGGDSSGTDIKGSMKYHDEAIALGMLAQFLKLGQTETGSRALGSEFIDFFLMSLQDTCEYICQVLNRFLIKELVDFNWNVKEYPELKCDKMNEISPTVIGTLISTGVITKDFEIENIMRNRLNLPVMDEDTYNERHSAPDFSKNDPVKDDKDEEDENNGSSKKDTGSNKGNSKSNKKDIDEEDVNNTQKTKKVKASDDRTYKTIDERILKLSPEEQIPNLRFIERSLDSAEDSLLSELIKIKEKQISYISLKLSSGAKMHQITVPHKKDMFNAMKRNSKNLYRAGYKEMISEIEKQRPDLFVNKDNFSFADYGKPMNQFMQWQSDVIETDVEGAANKLLAMMSKKALSIKKRILSENVSFSDKEIESELSIYGSKISNNTYKEMASGSTNPPFGEGRGNAVHSFEDYIEYLYRSAILDKNLCTVCRGKNGLTFEVGDTSEDQIIPDPDCLGGKRCRCIIIAVMKVENETA